MDSLGRRICRQRRVKGLSQEELADLIGVSRQTISKWESNSMQPTLENVKLLCSQLGVSIDYFTHEELKSGEDADEIAISLESIATEKSEVIWN